MIISPSPSGSALLTSSTLPLRASAIPASASQKAAVNAKKTVARDGVVLKRLGIATGTIGGAALVGQNLSQAGKLAEMAQEQSHYKTAFADLGKKVDAVTKSGAQSALKTAQAHADVLEKMGATTESLETKLADAQEKLITLKNNADAYQTNIHALQQECGPLNGLQKAAKTLKKDFGDLGEKSKSFTQNFKGLDEKAETLKTSFKTFEDKAATLKKGFAGFDTHASQLDSKTVSLTDKLAKLAEQAATAGLQTVEHSPYSKKNILIAGAAVGGLALGITNTASIMKHSAILNGIPRNLMGMLQGLTDDIATIDTVKLAGISLRIKEAFTRIQCFNGLVEETQKMLSASQHIFFEPEYRTASKDAVTLAYQRFMKAK